MAEKSFGVKQINMIGVGTPAIESSDDLIINTNGSERIRILGDGDVGIGTTNPESKLVIAGNSATAQIEIKRTDSNATGTVGALNFTAFDGHSVANISAIGDGDNEGADIVFRTTSAAGENSPFGGSTAERARITSDGKIQITGTRGGTLQPSDNDTLELYTSATTGNASTGGGITFYNHDGSGHEMGGVIHVVKQNGTDDNTASNMLFGTRVNGSAVAYRARLTSGGNWETFSTGTNIDISNTQSSGNNEAYIYARYGSTSMTAGTLSFRVYTNGNVQNTNNSYGSISDQNLKENIVDATSQWNDIKALQVRKYNFREATGHQTHTQIGLIAQEVETVSPGLVETTAVREGETVLDADGNQLESIKSINYSVLYMKSIKALQEAQTRIETLETQNTDLLARVTALENP